MEFLIRVADKGVALDASKRGDIIWYCPDGWAWSPAELTNPDWRIVSVANILQTAVDALLSVSPAPGVKRRREYMIDFSLLPDPSLFVGARTQAIVTLTKKQVTDAAVKKA